MDLYDWGRAAIYLAQLTHKLIGVYLAKVQKRASRHISIDAAVFKLNSAFHHLRLRLRLSTAIIANFELRLRAANCDTAYCGTASDLGNGPTRELRFTPLRTEIRISSGAHREGGDCSHRPQPTDLHKYELHRVSHLQSLRTKLRTLSRITRRSWKKTV